MTGNERARAAVFSLIFLVGGYVLTFPIFVVAAEVVGVSGRYWLDLVVLQSVAMLVSYGLLSWAIGGQVLKLSRADFERPWPWVGRCSWDGPTGAPTAEPSFNGWAPWGL